ncbi:MAG TPA: glycosyltransferase family 39 protein [Candidatus Saccharimonadales bacterium]|nr:glycosyltransferase family 39 protein [Candidatus Saccharimonadales bacterium]
MTFLRKFLYQHRLFIIIFIIGSFLRLYNLNWDGGFYLQPDERLFVNASTLSFPTSWSQFFSVSSPLNPHMFYYGSFLLYLYKIIHDVFFSSQSFLLISRTISSVFSIATIPLIYLLGKQFFVKKIALLATLVFTFSIGSIQYAHFNTTESFLVLLVTTITYLSILVIQTKQLKISILLGILLGISFGTKITGLVFGIIPLLSFVYLFMTTQTKIKIIYWFVFFLVISVVVGAICAPYQIIDWSTFFSQTNYMEGVTYGTFKPPFVIIYENTFPYIYQFLYIFPFILGFISLPLSLIGFFQLSKKTLHERKIVYLFLFVFPLLYFLWSGAWYAKYERYYVLLLPFMSLWAGFALSKLNKLVLWICILLIMFNGILYLRVYAAPHTRIAASQWIYQHIPNNSTLASEYWDDALPLLLPGESKNFQNITINVYDPDTHSKIERLAAQLSHADYVILSSRRVSASIMNNSQEYPYTTTYYRLLFSGQLGFSQVAEFSNSPFIISDDFADETFQSYDHPPVVILKNIKKLSPSKLFSLMVASGALH